MWFLFVSIVVWNIVYFVMISLEVMKCSIYSYCVVLVNKGNWIIDKINFVGRYLL